MTDIEMVVTNAGYYLERLRSAYGGRTAQYPAAVVAAATAGAVATIAEEVLRRPTREQAERLARACTIAAQRSDEAAHGFVGPPLDHLQLQAAQRAVRGALWGLQRLVEQRAAG